MSATSGETTTVSPPMISAGTWKHNDFPEPVGITVNTLRPSRTASIADSCPGRKSSKPNTSLRTWRFEVCCALGEFIRVFLRWAESVGLYDSYIYGAVGRARFYTVTRSI